MASSDKDTQGNNEEAKQPFVSRKDRPEVRIDLDTPVSELRVRDLSAILGFVAGKNPNFEVGKTILKDFFDKPFPEVVKDWLKEFKSDKLEKIEKVEKPEKYEKSEKLEKQGWTEKSEKLERTETVDPTFSQAPDPRFEQLIQAVSGLAKQVSYLTNQVEELRKKVSD
jgi:hypothetical protein